MHEAIFLWIDISKVVIRVFPPRHTVYKAGAPALSVWHAGDNLAATLGERGCKNEITRKGERYGKPESNTQRFVQGN
jgi:hypothetical protein